MLALVDGGVVARVGEAGVTVVLPGGWHTLPRPLAGLTPTVTDPLTRVVAVSAPFRYDVRGCQVAAYDFPRTAVAIVVVEWVELGRGCVDVKGCVAALKDAGFDGWAIVELDRVVDAGGTPIASAQANRTFVVDQLGLTL